MKSSAPLRTASNSETADTTQLQKRLDLLRIDDKTKASLALAFPVFQEEIDSIVAKFYDHITAFPEAAAILKSRHQVAALKFKQKKHWSSLFSCAFDEKYVASAVRIGTVHFQHGVAPYLYIAGYTFFHCALIDALTARQSLAADLPRILAAITRVISLDIDLALSVYTREYWRQAAAGPSPHWIDG